MAVVDLARMLVAVTAEGEAGEIVSAALVVTPEQQLEQLVGGFALIHAGFILSLIDEAEARSRLQVFAALGGGESAIDLAEFYDATTGAASAPRLQGTSGIAADAAAPSVPEVMHDV